MATAATSTATSTKPEPESSNKSTDAKDIIVSQSLDYLTGPLIARYLTDMKSTGFTLDGIGVLILYLSMGEIKKGIGYGMSSMGNLVYDAFAGISKHLQLKFFTPNSITELPTYQTPQYINSEFDVKLTIDFCKCLLKYIEEHVVNESEGADHIEDIEGAESIITKDTCRYTEAPTSSYIIDSLSKTSITVRMYNILFNYNGKIIELVSPLNLTYEYVDTLTNTTKTLTSFDSVELTTKEIPADNNVTTIIDLVKCNVMKVMLDIIYDKLNTQNIVIYDGGVPTLDRSKKTFTYTSYIGSTLFIKNQKLEFELFTYSKGIALSLCLKYPKIRMYDTIVYIYFMILQYIKYINQIGINITSYCVSSYNFFGLDALNNVNVINPGMLKAYSRLLSESPYGTFTLKIDTTKIDTRCYHSDLKMLSDHYSHNNLDTIVSNSDNLSVLCISDYVENVMNVTTRKLRSVYGCKCVLILSKNLQIPISDKKYSESDKKTQNILFRVYCAEHANSKRLFNSFLKDVKLAGKLSKECKDDISVYTLLLNKKSEEIKVDNPEYAKYSEQKDALLEIKDSKKSEFELTELLKSIPPKHLITTKIEKTVMSDKICTLSKAFDTLYLKRSDETLLKNTLDRFANKQSLLKELGLPNKLCILLTGLPGCGKTSTISAIATYLKSDIFYLSFKNIETNEDFMKVVQHVTSNSNGIIVLEDVDALGDLFLEREGKYSEDFVDIKSFKKTSVELTETQAIQMSEDKLNLGYVLNVLNGALTPAGLKFILTTNHAKVLDRALVRPGRMDLVCVLTKCDAYQLQKIYNRFFSRKLDKTYLDKLVVMGLTPAAFIEAIKEYVGFVDIPDGMILSRLLGVMNVTDYMDAHTTDYMDAHAPEFMDTYDIKSMADLS